MRKLFYMLVTAATLAHAAPSHAAGGGFDGYYLATFSMPNGSFQHCFHLTAAANTVPGYKISGTWVDTDFPKTAGQFVAFKGTLHLAGYVGDPGGTDYLTIDGQIMFGMMQHATFDYFTPAGLYLAAGSLAERKDPSCKS